MRISLSFGWIVFLGLVIFVMGVIAAWLFSPVTLNTDWSKTEDLRNWAILIGAIFGFPIFIWRAFAADRSANAAEQGNITERYVKAVEQLGSDSLFVRIGAIYGLERISIDSLPDYRHVMEILAAFVKSKLRLPADMTKVQAILARQKPKLKDVPSRGADIAAALIVIGRRKQSDHRDEPLLDLSMTNLDGALLQGMNLRGISFFRSALPRAGLQGADLTGSDLRKAILVDAKLTDAILHQAMLHKANLTGAKVDDGINQATGITEEQLSRAIKIKKPS